MSSSWCTRCHSEGEPTPPNNMIQCATPRIFRKLHNRQISMQLICAILIYLDCGIDINRPSCIRNFSSILLLCPLISAVFRRPSATNLGVSSAIRVTILLQRLCYLLLNTLNSHGLLGNGSPSMLMEQWYPFSEDIRESKYPQRS